MRVGPTIIFNTYFSDLQFSNFNAFRIATFHNIIFPFTRID